MQTMEKNSITRIKLQFLNPMATPYDILKKLSRHLQRLKAKKLVNHCAKSLTTTIQLCKFYFAWFFILLFYKYYQKNLHFIHALYDALFPIILNWPISNIENIKRKLLSQQALSSWSCDSINFSKSIKENIRNTKLHVVFTFPVYPSSI